MASISLKYKSKQGNLTAPGDVDPGAMIPISTTTLSTATATVTFSNIPQNYEHLQLRYMSGDQRASSVDSPIYLRFNSDTSTSYSFHEILGNGTNAESYASPSQTLLWLYGGGALAFGVGVGDILDYTNTNKYKTMRTLTGDDNNGSGFVRLNSGLWQKTNAIDTITLTPFSGNFRQYSHFALYGIKRAGA